MTTLKCVFIYDREHMSQSDNDMTASYYGGNVSSCAYITFNTPAKSNGYCQHTAISQKTFLCVCINDVSTGSSPKHEDAVLLNSTELYSNK